jgi:hypothetical protein
MGSEQGIRDALEVLEKLIFESKCVPYFPGWTLN